MVDSSLERIGRRLRMLGFDVLPASGSSLEALFQRARAEGRRVLTASARHPRRFADVPALVLPRDPAAAVAAVARRFRPAGPPFSRCSVCNGLLEPGAPGPTDVPEGVRREFSRLDRCMGCGRWYWPGSHVSRMRRWLEETVSRPIAMTPESEGLDPRE